MQTVKTIPGKTYAVESAGEVTITNTETGAIAAQGDGSGQVLFTACSNSYTVSDDAAKVAALFKLAPRLKLALLQGGAGGWLPKGFTELEYLEHPSTTEQFVLAYIQLPLPDVTSPQDSLAYETEHFFEQPTTTKESEGVPINYGSFGCGYVKERGTYMWIDGTLNTTSGNPLHDWVEPYTTSLHIWEKIHYYVGNSLNPYWQITVNDVVQLNKNISWGAVNRPRKVFYIFGYPSQSGDNADYTQRVLRGKKRSAKIWVNGQLLYDLRPVLRNSDGTAGFWDKVSKQFFENAGEGSFGYRIKTSGGSAGYSLRDPYYTAPQRPEPTVKARRTDVGVEIVPAEQPVEGEEWVYFSSTQDAELYFREETEELLTE